MEQLWKELCALVGTSGALLGSFWSALETWKQGVHGGEQRPGVYVKRVQKFLLKPPLKFMRYFFEAVNRRQIAVFRYKRDDSL